MAKKTSKKRATELLMEPESDDHFAYIAGYTSGGTPYGITREEQEKIERNAAAKNSVIPPGTLQKTRDIRFSCISARHATKHEMSLVSQ